MGGRGNYYIAVFKINMRPVFFYAVGAHKRRKLILCYRVLCKKIFLYFFNALFAVASAAELSGSYDLLFSNACLQWIPDHEQLIPQLMAHLTDGGALAVQIPMNQEEPLFRAIHAVVSDGKWGFSHSVSGQNKVLSPDSYFNILSGCSTRFEMWETVYYHALPSHEHLMQWVRETRLRPYLSVLEAPEQRSLEQEILDKARDSYPVMGSGEIILRFRRFFFIACKN